MASEPSACNKPKATVVIPGGPGRDTIKSRSNRSEPTEPDVPQYDFRRMQSRPATTVTIIYYYSSRHDNSMLGQSTITVALRKFGLDHLIDAHTPLSWT